MTGAVPGGVGRGGLPGEPDGFREFVETRSRMLLRAAWLLTGDWDAAEDLVQSALAAAWSRWSSLTRPEAPERYVQRIMLTTFLRWGRRRWIGEIPFGVLPERSDGVDPFDASDLRRSLTAALEPLPAQQRAAVVLRYFLDLSEAQTASVLGCSVGSVKTHTSRALAKLRRTPGLAEIMTGGVAS